MNKDQIKGRMAEAKGTIKEIAGKVTGRKILARKGKLLKTGGKARAGYGDIKDAVKKDQGIDK